MCAHGCSASAKTRMDTHFSILEDACRVARQAMQPSLRLPLNLAGAHAAQNDKEAVAAGRVAPALQHLQRLLANKNQTTRQAALSSCGEQAFLPLPGALPPRAAAPRPQATPWTQAASSPKRGGCVDTPFCHAKTGMCQDTSASVMKLSVHF